MPISATQACEEAAASAPKNEVMLITIEPIRPVFVENALLLPFVPSATRTTYTLVQKSGLQEAAAQ
jgi:hypothetical protein